MLKIGFSPSCLKKLKKIKRKQPELFSQISSQLHIFQINPKHPSLRLHKLAGSHQESWSVSVNMSYRLLFYYASENQEISVVFFAVGKHEEVYD